MAFMQAGWTTHLGSYYVDHVSKIPRELDVLIQKEKIYQPKQHHGLAVGKFHARMRVLCSCKGFPTDLSPITYSLSGANHSDLLYQPIFTSMFRGNFNIGRLDRIAKDAANLVIKRPELQIAGQVIAFDTYKMNDPQRYEKKKDEILFGGLDSAIKACAHWHYLDVQAGDLFATLSVPLLVTLIPALNFSIDFGTVSEAELRHCGQVTNSYPILNEHLTLINVPITALLCDESRLPFVIAALETIWTRFNELLEHHRPFDSVTWPIGF